MSPGGSFVERRRDLVPTDPQRKRVDDWGRSSKQRYPVAYIDVVYVSMGPETAAVNLSYRA